MNLITDNDELRAFCAPLATVDYVTVDTEFIRERTYWPVLCLLQIGGPDGAAAVDALAPGIDLAPVFELLANRNVLKVFHAARQDMEIFCRAMDDCPAPVFDTQIAAMVCGFGDSVGYETLVAKLAKATVDKSSRFTDWAARPLSDKQISYALSDVTHLRTVYEKLQAKLEKSGRLAWVASEMEALHNRSFYETDPMEAYERLKVRRPSPRLLAILREVAAWREIEAQRADVPRNRIVRDESIVEIAHHPPKSIENLARIRGLSQKMAEGWQGRQIMEAVERGRALPDDECPTPVEKLVLPRGIGPVADLLKVFLKMCAEESGVAQRLIANSEDIDTIAAFGEDADVPALKGWRRELFGEAALKLRDGRMGLAIKDRVLTVVDL
ncbi:MAG TPA: ribonuclease D [Rhodospirillaceae bacterium]|nr:ribonuclease D [Magnetovibrio sp.]HBT43122.1 ribonuclease D [Rhodospirillaceae bacterium]HCS69242.1 ribonuclease D [Rhodospirillaceae bacterium]|tara:strand:- start:6132 stop:7283 length:1152 start_codon:yes stop_codon:yes gene_type:complete